MAEVPGLDEHYTLEDHQFRARDPYAMGKYRLTVRWLQASSPAGATLYNVGCGAGLFNEVAAAAGFAVVGFEPDPAAFELAAASARGWTVVNKGLGELEDEPKAAIVVVHDVLEHIEDDLAATAQLRRLVRPDGVLAISVPALPSLFGIHDEQLGHYRRYTKASLRAAVGDQFTFRRLRYYGMSFVPVTWWLSRVRRAPYPVDEATGSGILGRAMRTVTAIESRAPTPIGTSLVGLLQPR